jgi:hypothetical protein
VGAGRGSDNQSVDTVQSSIEIVKAGYARERSSKALKAFGSGINRDDLFYFWYPMQNSNVFGTPIAASDHSDPHAAALRFDRRTSVEPQ